MKQDKTTETSPTDSNIGSNESLLHEIKSKIDSLISNPQKDLGDWIPEKAAQELTGKKTTSLWKLRVAGKLVASKIGGKVFYRKSGIIQLLENNILKD